MLTGLDDSWTFGGILNDATDFPFGMYMNICETFYHFKWTTKTCRLLCQLRAENLQWGLISDTRQERARVTVYWLQVCIHTSYRL